MAMDKGIVEAKATNCSEKLAIKACHNYFKKRLMEHPIHCTIHIILHKSKNNVKSRFDKNKDILVSN